MTVGPTTRRRRPGADLRRLRERKGLTLEESGSLVGISKATLSRYESKQGAVKWPAVDALCRAYGTTDDEPLLTRRVGQGRANPGLVAFARGPRPRVHEPHADPGGRSGQ